MAALAFPTYSASSRRPRSTQRRPSTQVARHLRLVQAPIFDDPIFDELEQESSNMPSAWSVWERSLPSIPRRQLVRERSDLSASYTTIAPNRPSPLSSRESSQWGAPRAALVIEQAVRVPVASPSQRLQRYRVRRFVSCVALALVLFGVFSGASALAGSHQGAAVAVPGSVAVPGGYAYTVRPGDTLWSIAERVYPNGDPRSLVSRLEAQIHSATPVPGEHLILP